MKFSHIKRNSLQFGEETYVFFGPAGMIEVRAKSIMHAIRKVRA